MYFGISILNHASKHFHIRLNKENLQLDEAQWNAFLQTVFVEKLTSQLVTIGQTSYWSILIFYDKEAVPTAFHIPDKEEKLAITDVLELTVEEQARYEALHKWRGDLARLQSQPGYVIATNAELAAIVRLNPTAVDELYGVKRKSANMEDIIMVLSTV